MQHKSSFNAKLEFQLSQDRFLYLLWMILNKRNLLDELDYHHFDKQSIRFKASALDNGFLNNIIENMVHSSAMHIFQNPSKRKYLFIKNEIIQKYDNKEVQLPPSAKQQDILFAMFDSLPSLHEEKLRLLENIEVAWNKNTTPDELFDWYREEFSEKKEIHNQKTTESKNNDRTLNKMPQCTNYSR